jgi:dTDP-4-dehydrorhamnose reductase
MDKKILITGANGLLGQKLISLYGNQPSYEILATGLGPLRLKARFENVRYSPMDICNRDEVFETLSDFKPDAVINTAAMTNVDQCETEQAGCRKLNVDAVGNLIDAAEEKRFFLLHLGTDFIFDGLAGPYSEEAIPNPLSFYGQSKWDADQLLIKSKAKWAIARTILVYGIAEDMSRSNIILWVKKNLEEGKPIKVVTDQWRTPTLAEDLALGCKLIVGKEAQGIFHISGKDLLTPYDMAIATADYFKLDRSLISKADSSNFSQPAKRPAKTGFIIDKARKVLGFEPLSFEEGLAKVASQMAPTT